MTSSLAPFLLLGLDPAEGRVHGAILLLVAATFVSLLARRLRVPYTVALVLMGLLLGFTHWLDEFRLSPEIVLLVFLPPILFEGTLAMDARLLRDCWREISLLALGVTLGSCLGIGVFTHLALGWPWPAAMLVGAILSATDPVSVLALMREVGAPRRLSLMLEAESCLNDGIGVVLFLVMRTFGTGGHVTLGEATVLFVKEAAGGLLLGAGVAALACRLIRLAHDHLTEIMLTIALAYGAYVVCTAVQVSGIMGVIAAGVVMGATLPRLLSDASRASMHEAWEVLAFLANSVLFLFIGTAFVHGSPWRAMPEALVVFAGMTVLRLGLVFALVSRFMPVSWRWVLTWGGVRGSIPLALALALPALSGEPGRDEVVSVVFGVVLLSLLAQGLTIGAVMRRLGVTADTAPG